MPLNITAASDSYGHYNLMPVYGNNFNIINHRVYLLTNVYLVFSKRSKRVQYAETPHVSLDSCSR